MCLIKKGENNEEQVLVLYRWKQTSLNSIRLCSGMFSIETDNGKRAMKTMRGEAMQQRS